jgi:TM2 domain-containing membrane protein YozV
MRGHQLCNSSIIKFWIIVITHFSKLVIIILPLFFNFVILPFFLKNEVVVYPSLLTPLVKIRIGC